MSHFAIFKMNHAYTEYFIFYLLRDITNEHDG